MDYITRKVKERGEVFFSALCHELGMTREVVIVTFLAVLELIRRHRIGYDQPELFDDIRLFRSLPQPKDSTCRADTTTESNEETAPWKSGAPAASAG